MSAAFTQALAALNANPELAKQVMAAGTPAERAEILKEAGVPVPTHADINAYHASLSGISGAGASTTSPIDMPVSNPVCMSASAV